MGDISPERRSGCGLLGAMFGRRSIWPRRTTSASAIQSGNVANNVVTRVPSTPNSKRRRGGSDEASFLESDDVPQKQQVDRIIARPGQNYTKTPPVYQQFQRHNQQQNHHQNQGKKAPESETGEPRNSSNQQGYNQGRKVPHGATGISGELESMINDHQRSKGAGSLVRASSSNVMLYGNLGNLRQSGNNNGNTNSTNVLDYLPKTANEPTTNGKYPTSVMGNVVKKTDEPGNPGSLCRALSTRMDPEQLKILGNEDYKNGKFAEALALYEAAISIDPDKASYRSNKSAALTALGRLLEAAFECREAIRIDPYYQRAHNRLATLYVRLGEAEKAVYHFKHAGADADPDQMNKANKVQIHLNKCTEAKRQRDWNTLLKQTGLAIAAGADSAPLIFALKAEALMKLHRYQEADDTMTKGPNFDTDECTKFFGPIGSATLLLVRAQVDMTAGRFDDAVAFAQRAARLDLNNKEATAILRRAKAVAAARSNGNELFKAGRHSEACIAYGEGLSHDPHNAVLLSNRAASRSKLRQFEKAIEDCTAALNARPSYSKARLRRGDCFAKLEKWEACIQDCEILLRENPDDEEVARIIKEAQLQLRKQGIGRNIMNMSNGAVHGASTIVEVSSNERFRDYVTSPGISVVLFCKQPSDRKIMPFLEKLQRRFTSVNFLKVEVENYPSLAKSEGVNLFPTFVIYKNGSRAKDVPGNNLELLENTIKYYVN